MKVRPDVDGGKPDTTVIMILKVVKAILSFILMALVVLLPLVVLAQFLVFFIDSVIYGNQTYRNWLPSVYIPLGLALLAFVLYMALNLNRFKLTSGLLKKMRSKKTQETMEPIELD